MFATVYAVHAVLAEAEETVTNRNLARENFCKPPHLPNIYYDQLYLFVLRH